LVIVETLRPPGAEKSALLARSAQSKPERLLEVPDGGLVTCSRADTPSI
jgi:hypothetical protein